LPNPLNSGRKPKGETRHFISVDESQGVEALPRPIFTRMLCVERNRAERSGRRLVLMLLESASLLAHDEPTGAAYRIQYALSRSTRETDIVGWYRDGAVMGVIFTEIPAGGNSVVPVLSGKVSRALQDVLSAHEVGQIDLSFHVFPDDCEGEDPGVGAFSTMYPDLQREMESKRVPLLIKRCLDIAGSLTAIMLLAPVLILIAIAVRLTSPGPVLFRQRRLGQYGKSFTFLKFRSMYEKSDHAVHEAYVKEFISNRTEGSESGARNDGEQSAVYKLKEDRRITSVGRFLRRSSLDELPQFFNVLTGHMSLVGPRPPVPYEFAAYEMWHRRRLLGVKPGITGFWQVEGRSRVRFDEMVRMDLEYARAWSLWLDIKILLQTPRAVISGHGAY
jgi:lipopolysaccharide/colanic/teichoic acid biosynthesis glycosyltransferase